MRASTRIKWEGDEGEGNRGATSVTYLSLGRTRGRVGDAEGEGGGD